ncbi:hypothetical protein SCHPADRAFT_919777 [Schizopora paradoxa]|uniref:C2H2-type domain-containing protein n=1 Tax=Schizopora paradoxa TaxID=27342 RepID=A0A0H2RYC3_9AGAM|nr:hypothetical protein SCHPADRAFT_919777 [Schizopora paradoxa]
MLGVLYSAASDFGTFSYPRAYCPVSGVCLENHATAIEARYCPKQHVLQWNDIEWDNLVAKEEDALEDPENNDSLYSGFFLSPQLSLSDASTPPASVLSTPSLISDIFPEDDEQDECKTEPDVDSDSDYEEPLSTNLKLKIPISKPTAPFPPVNSPSSTTGVSVGVKRKRGKGGNKSGSHPKRICRMVSSTSVTTLSSVSSVASSISRSSSSTPSNADAHLIAPSEAPPGTNPWKCPYCPWIQHTQRLPDFLRHQRSHFVSQSDWPCPNPECGKGFARKDSLKRHLDNRATGCRRPPGYTVC